MVFICCVVGRLIYIVVVKECVFIWQETWSLGLQIFIYLSNDKSDIWKK
jgi:hypothetical protein